jgi:hypothetical protein
VSSVPPLAEGRNRKLTRNCDPEIEFVSRPLTEIIGREGGTEIGRARRPANTIFNVLRGVRIDCAVLYCPNLFFEKVGIFYLSNKEYHGQVLCTSTTVHIGI